MQLNLFQQPDLVHRCERGAGNQNILETNRPHLNRQCRRVFELLMTGKKFTTFELNIQLGMTDSRRRLGELKHAGINLRTELSEDGRYKNWWMTQEDINKNIKI